MLRIVYGDMPEAIFNTALYFDNTYLDKWITDDFGRRVIKAVDKSTVLSGQAVDSKALGVIPVTKVSGGVKTLLLIRNEPEKVFNASTCGDNCARWILRIAADLQKEQGIDVTINLRHMMDFGDRKFEIEVVNSHTVVHNMRELVLQAVHFL